MRKLFNFMPIIFLSVGMVFFYQSCTEEDKLNLSNVQETNFRNDGAGSGTNMDFILDFDLRFVSVNPNRKSLTEIISVAICRKPVIKQAIKFLVTDFKSNYNMVEDEMFLNFQKDLSCSVLGGKSLAQVLIETVPEKPVAEILDFACKNDPGLALLLEGNLNSNDVSDDVYIDENFDDSNLNSAIFIYNCGIKKQKTISEVENNSKMVFIIRESEAFSPTTTLNNGFVETKNLGKICGNDVIVIGNSINDNGGEPTIDSTGNDDDAVNPRSNPCPNEWRTVQNGKENLYRYKTDNDYDPARGKGEFLQYAIHGKDVKYNIDEISGKVEITGAVTTHVAKRQEDVRDNFKWKEVNADLFRWNPEDNGYTYKLVWIEDDNGNSKPLIKSLDITVKAKLPNGTTVEGGAKFEFNKFVAFLTNGDDFIGECIIDYCDPELFDYTPNSLDVTVFNVNER